MAHGPIATNHSKKTHSYYVITNNRLYVVTPGTSSWLLFLITRLLDQRAGVMIGLSGLSIEPADSSWCDEVGSGVESGRRNSFLRGNFGNFR